MLQRRHLLVYGTYRKEDADRVEALLTDFAERCLNAGFGFVTRNGVADGDFRAWAGQDDALPVDNVIIDAVKRYCERADGKVGHQQSRGSNRTLEGDARRWLRSYVSSGRCRYINIGQEIIEAPATRPQRYRRFISETALIVFIGGGHGVSRLIAKCEAKRHPFLAITAFGGFTQEMVSDSYREVEDTGFFQALSIEICRRLQDRNITGAELYAFMRRNTSPWWRLWASLGRVWHAIRRLAAESLESVSPMDRITVFVVFVCAVAFFGWLVLETVLATVDRVKGIWRSFVE